MSAGFFALGPPFFGRTVLVILLDFLAVYFAVGLLFDLVTLTSVLITTVRLGTTPMAFYEGKLVGSVLWQSTGDLLQQMAAWVSAAPASSR